MIALAGQRFKIAPNVHTREFNGELVILDLKGGQYFSLNELGTRAWAALEKGQTMEDLARAIAGEYDVPAEKLLADLCAMIGELVARGLVGAEGPEAEGPEAMTPSVLHAAAKIALRVQSVPRAKSTVALLASILPIPRGPTLAHSVARRLEGRGSCLTRAVAIAACCPGSVLHIGVLRRGPPFRAHAWVEIEGEPVEDEESIQSAELARFG